MSRPKVRKLKSSLRQKDEVISKMTKEKKFLEKRIVELEASCENFSEVELNLHKEIAELKQKKPSGLKEKIVNLFS